MKSQQAVIRNGQNSMPFQNIPQCEIAGIAHSIVPQQILQNTRRLTICITLQLDCSHLNYINLALALADHFVHLTDSHIHFDFRQSSSCHHLFVGIDVHVMGFLDSIDSLKKVTWTMWQADAALSPNTAELSLIRKGWHLTKRSMGDSVNESLLHLAKLVNFDLL